MKRHITFLTLAIFILFTQCSEDSPTAKTYETPFGTWRFVDDPLFSYLVLFNDHTFLYAEGGGAVSSPEEDGLELGSFSYNNETGEISFDINYDDNDPGNDSGIGDIGKSVTYDATVSNDDKTLTIANGVLVLNLIEPISSSPILGTWRRVNGTEFNCLILFEDSTFLYAEKGGVINSPEEDGLELGTYSYDEKSGDITFTLTYDDNDPGNDSGVGDIGTPATYALALSNSNKTLSIENGELVLTKEF